MKTIIGIDFGTSNTVISIKTIGCDETTLIDLGCGKYIPTVVRLNESLEKGDVFGEDAYENYGNYASRTFSNFKIEIEKNFPDSILKTANIEFLKLIKKEIQDNQYGGADIDFINTQIVVGIPGHWLPFRDRVTALFEEAGFSNIKTFPEPLAAAVFSLAKTNSLQDIPKRTILIIDCGAGTTDLSVLEWKDNKSVLPISLGGTTLAGNDFDSIIVEDIKSKLKISDGSILLSPWAKEIKEELTSKKKISSSIFVKAINRRYTYETTRKDFAQNSTQLLTELTSWISSKLTDRHIDISSISHVFLTGGMALCPILRDSISKIMAGTNCAIDLMDAHDPRSVVALGLASSPELIPVIIDAKGKEIAKSLDRLKSIMFDELASEKNKKLLDTAITCAVEKAWSSISTKEIIFNIFNKDKLANTRSIKALQKSLSTHLEPCIKKILDSLLAQYLDSAENIIKDSFHDLGQLFESNLCIAAAGAGGADQSITELDQVGKKIFISLMAAIVAAACSTMVTTTSTAMLGLIVTTAINPLFIAATVVSAIIAVNLGKDLINYKMKIINKIIKKLTTLPNICDLSSKTGKETIYAKIWNPNENGEGGLEAFFNNFFPSIWETGHANTSPLREQLLDVIEGTP